MSGGSYDYLCHADAAKLFDMEEQLQRMADRLAGLGYASDAAGETMQALLDVRIARNRLQSRMDRLSGVWSAVEWWDSCDTTEDGVRLALEKFRNQAP